MSTSGSILQYYEELTDMGNCCEKINHFDTDQKYKKIKKNCKKDGTLWEDPKFEASSSMLAESTTDDVEWLR